MSRTRPHSRAQICPWLDGTDSPSKPSAAAPHGRWLAYSSNRSGRREVYARRFLDATSAQLQVSIDGGAEAVWAHGGRELFYVNGVNELVAVHVTGDPTFEPGQQEVLFSLSSYLESGGHPMHDVSPDDQRFVTLRIEDQATYSELILVDNWAEELRERVGN